MLRKLENVQCPITKGGRVARLRVAQARRGLPASIFQTAIRATAQAVYKVKENGRLF